MNLLTLYVYRLGVTLGYIMGIFILSLLSKDSLGIYLTLA